MIFDFFKRKKNNIKLPTPITFGKRQPTKDSQSFSCVDKIASAFASLSFGIYNKKTKQKTEHYLSELLNEPNLDETHFLFFYSLVLDYYNSGNIFIYKYVDKDTKKITSLFRIDPLSVTVERNLYNQKVFKFNDEEYNSQTILHIPSRYGYDGLVGKPITKEQETTFNTALNLDSYSANTFDNSLGKKLIIDITEAYPNATEDELNKIRDRFSKNYGGLENAGKPIVTTSKIKYSNIDSGIVDNRAQQLTENRTFQQEAIQQVFNIPIEYLNGKVNTDLETLTTLFMTQAIQPLVVCFEESLNKLFSISERKKYYIEFNYNSILRTSLTSKIDAYTKQVNNGFLTPNEVRAKENNPPLEAGDFAFIPANLMPLTNENINQYMAKSKIEIENQEKAKTMPNVGSDKI